MSEFDPPLFEEEFFEKRDKKAERKKRRRAVLTDRSKYKKTDFSKREQEEAREVQKKLQGGDYLRGRVTSIRSDGVLVDGKTLCTLRGLLKKTKTMHKNVITVGDIVLYDKEATIVFIEPRSSFLSRADSISQKKEQMLAANVDQVIITSSACDPTLKPALIDRYIIAALKGNLEPIVVINKMDLLTKSERAIIEEFTASHEKVGIPVFLVSATTGEGLDALREAMKDKASVFSGQSGVGKSSLINALSGFTLRVGETVEKTKKGSHTTTIASLLPLPFGGWVVDTPGVRSFGVWDIKREELPYYFPEFDAFRTHCKFPTCLHLEEPGCAVREAAEKGEISTLRYSSYCNLSHEIEKEVRRR